ncbi:MAG: hypothetical protein QM658_13210 [Gordonia sp. (in: high G+C Gram-positive bacteria)]
MSTVEALEAIGRRASAELQRARCEYRGRTSSTAHEPSVHPAQDTNDLCDDLLDRVMVRAQFAARTSDGRPGPGARS